MARSLRDRLHRRLRADDERDLADDAGEDDAGGGGPAVGVDDDQPTKIEASTLPTSSSHIPDAAAVFDPWGLRESTSYDSPGFNLRWVEAMLGQQQPE
jgi:hypothetical protein